MDKVIRMCIIHDLGEAFTGDIPAFDKTQADVEKEDALQEQLGVPVITLKAGSKGVFDDAFYGSMELLGKVFGKFQKDQTGDPFVGVMGCRVYDLPLPCADDQGAHRALKHRGGQHLRPAKGIGADDSLDHFLTALGCNGHCSIDNYHKNRLRLFYASEAICVLCNYSACALGAFFGKTAFSTPLPTTNTRPATP